MHWHIHLFVTVYTPHDRHCRGSCLWEWRGPFDLDSLCLTSMFDEFECSLYLDMSLEISSLELWVAQREPSKKLQLRFSHNNMDLLLRVTPGYTATPVL